MANRRREGESGRGIESERRAESQVEWRDRWTQRKAQLVWRQNLNPLDDTEVRSEARERKRK